MSVEPLCRFPVFTGLVLLGPVLGTPLPSGELEELLLIKRGLGTLRSGGPVGGGPPRGRRHSRARPTRWKSPVLLAFASWCLFMSGVNLAYLALTRRVEFYRLPLRLQLTLGDLRKELWVYLMTASKERKGYRRLVDLADWKLMPLSDLKREIQKEERMEVGKGEEIITLPCRRKCPQSLSAQGCIVCQNIQNIKLKKETFMLGIQR